ncbi:unnamed protein product, partial [Oikopleura dioica]
SEDEFKRTFERYGKMEVKSKQYFFKFREILMRQKQILFFVIFIEILKNILLFKKSCKLVYDQKREESRGFGFVTYENIEDAIYAKKDATGMEMNGHELRIDYSITKRAHSPTPGCYLGSKGDRRGDRRGSRRSRSRERYSRHGKRSRSRSREYRRRSPSPYRRRSPSPYRSRRSRSR